jgi:hypothetical protein
MGTPIRSARRHMSGIRTRRPGEMPGAASFDALRFARLA